MSHVLTSYRDGQELSLGNSYSYSSLYDRNTDKTSINAC